jgi:hypothetical protein
MSGLTTQSHHLCIREWSKGYVDAAKASTKTQSGLSHGAMVLIQVSIEPYYAGPSRTAK